MTWTNAADAEGLLRRRIGGRRVLVIEDQYFIADEIRHVLVEAGAHVVGPAPDMERGLALLKSRAVDLAVLDIDLDGEAVFPLASALRARNVPWIYVSGYGSATIPGHLKGRAFIEKPINKTAFIDALQTLV